MEESDLQGQLLELMFSRSALKMKPNAKKKNTVMITYACMHPCVLHEMTIIILLSWYMCYHRYHGNS